MLSGLSGVIFSLVAELFFRTGSCICCDNPLSCDGKMAPWARMVSDATWIVELKQEK
jgi:hypothetical protein